VINGVKKAAADAGATLTGQVALQLAFSDLSGSTLSTLSSVNGSVAASNGITLTTGADPQTASQQDAAQLIADAILSRQATQQAQGQQNQRSQQNQQGESVLSAASAQTLLSAYAQAGFITVSGTPTDRADLVIIIPPDSVPSDGASDPANLVLLAVAQEFASASAVTVIAGASAPSSQSGSAISAVRSSSVSGLVSTVDNADTTQGQITVMQAIATQLAGGQPSSYGMSGAASLSPVPAPTPAQASATSTPTGQATKSGNGGKQVNKK
jgi:hypothetical protein